MKEYLVSLGVSAARVDTISYGKEQPICTESTEDCWAQNRRGVTVIIGRRCRRNAVARGIEKRAPVRRPFSFVHMSLNFG